MRRELAELNERYFEKHGFVFLICATGKSAGEMRDQLVRRVGNSTDQEVVEAAQEQRKITRIRLQKALRELGGRREAMVEVRRDVVSTCNDRNAPFLRDLTEGRRGEDAMKTLDTFRCEAVAGSAIEPEMMRAHDVISHPALDRYYMTRASSWDSCR